MKTRMDQSRLEQFMKTRLLQIGWVVLCAAAVPLVGGCVEDSAAESSKAPPEATNLAPADAVPVAANSAVAEIPENAPPPERAEPAPGSASQSLPANLKLSPKTADLVKLSQAGVNDAVMLAFVTNTTSTFNLGSDQIVYLNDLGFPSEVLTAMIEHDRLLREGGGASAVTIATAPAAPDVATDVVTAPPPTEPPPPAVTETVPPPPANVTYNYFYDSLSPYGTWVDVGGYGYCWQPRVVILQSGWRPYCDGGRWVYSDYGWYWQSDYSWGWAPFHYGRWFCHPRWGWCWRPDSAWGPAWVSWRYTDAYCGWAPLPPSACYTAGVGFTYYGRSVGMSFGFGLGWSSYAFVPWMHFNDHRPYRYSVPHHEVRPIFEHSTVVNHIVVGNNHTIINHGIGADRVRQFTHTEVRPVHVREVALTERDHRAPGDRLDRSRRELVIQRPRLPETPSTPVAPPRMSAPWAPAAATAAANPPPSNRQPGPGRDRSPSESPSRQDRRAQTAVSAPASQMSAPVAPRTGTEVRSAPPPNRGTTPTSSAPSGRPARPERERVDNRQSARPNSALTTPATPAPSVPSKLSTTPPKNELYPPGSLVWNGRRETSPSAAPNPSASSSPPASRASDDRSRANMTTVWPRPAESTPRAVVTPPSQSLVVRTPAAPITPRVIEVPQPRTYTAPAPVVRSEPRYSSPPAPPTGFAPARPSYTPPQASRSEPAYAPRSAPSAPPSYSAPARSEPRSAPSSSSGGSGRSDQGRDNRRDR
jgi:hypothetical protein